MQLLNLTGPEVEAADAQPWDGPLAFTMRPFTTESLTRITLAAAFLYFLTSCGTTVIWLTSPSKVTSPPLWAVITLSGFVLAATLVGLVLFLSPGRFRRMVPTLGLPVMLVTPPLVSLGAAGGGPGLSLTTVAYVQAPIFAFYMLYRRFAILTAALVPLCFGVVCLLQDGWGPGSWIWVAAAVSSTSVVVGLIAARSDELASAEHASRVELAELNTDLEGRVAAQVREIESLSAFRRFLSPQVADAMSSHDSDEVTRPHRRRIAVFFCDLRGFTAFTNNAEPEEVIAVLDEYYRAVGGLLQRYDATVGDYAGDGVMAYFGDPVPREDAALAAVEMTRELVTELTPLVGEWQRCGFDLGFGVGIAFGYATLGVIGFDGRYDYKPVGGVVNLAARLCSRAEAGQALLDHATHAATVNGHPSTHVGDVELKGYGAPIRAYALGAS